MELTVRDSSMKRLSVADAFSMDADSGGEPGSESYELRLPVEAYGKVPLHGYVAVDGTQWGGPVDSKGADWSEARPQAVFRGRTWRGMLARLVVMPGSGHYVAKGDANAALGGLLYDAKAPWFFSAPSEALGVDVNVELPRFCTLLEGLSLVAKAAGGSLSVAFAGGRVAVSASFADAPRLTPSDCRLFAMRHSRPVNHLVCAGEGQEGERVLVHLYADESGRVSRTQSLFGADEVAEYYGYTSADEERLVESGTDRLRDYQALFEADASAPEGLRLEMGRAVSVSDPETGLSASLAVESASVEAGRNGAVESYALAMPEGGGKEAARWP